MLKECTYCSLPEIKNRTIIGNKLVRAFPTNIPITPGHTLIIPNRCVDRYELLTIEEKIAIEDLRIKIIEALTKTFSYEDFNFAWNQGSVAGQSVPHFHLHIVGRKFGDTAVYNYDPREFLYRPGSRAETPEEELIQVAAQIASAIK